MRYQLYQIIHLTGILMVFLAYGGMIVRAATGSDNKGLRRLGALTSGIGLFLILLGGFGLLAVLNYGWPIWVLVKVAIWVILGAMIAIINRKPECAQFTWWFTIILGMVALLMVILKPF
jgi:hypothetical protein